MVGLKKQINKRTNMTPNNNLPITNSNVSNEYKLGFNILF